MKNSTATVTDTNKDVKTTKTLGINVPTSKAVKEVVQPVKDLVKANLIKFLNTFSVVTTWDKKHKVKFENVLSGGLVSSQLTEYASLGYFLKRKNIKLIDKEGREVDFKSVFEMSDTLKDSKLIEKAGIKFGKAKQKYHTSFLADYALVFASIARGVKDYDNVDGIKGDEGKQILSFLSLINELGYTYK